MTTTEDALVEAVARALDPDYDDHLPPPCHCVYDYVHCCEECGNELPRSTAWRRARAAIAAARPIIEAEALERAAKVADECDRQDEIDNGAAMTGAAKNAADRIRALIPKVPT